MLRLAARHADAWNTAWYGAPDDRLHQQLTSFAKAIEAEGRDPATLTRTAGMIVRDPSSDVPDDEGEFAGSVDELARAIDAHDALGVDHPIIVLLPMTESSLDRLSGALRLRAGRA